MLLKSRPLEYARDILSTQPQGTASMLGLNPYAELRLISSDQHRDFARYTISLV
jgi:hypothetical protein